MEEILTPAQIAAADRFTIVAGTPGIELMERAGAAVAEAAMRRSARGARIAVVCGPGNNGGDGFVAARLLREQGFEVCAALIGRREALRGDAARAAERWTGRLLSLEAVLADASLVIDALFGAGLSRDLTGEARDAVAAIGRCGAPVLAVDLPSGIDGETGQVRGAAVRAVETVTFARRKPGHVLLPGRIHAGVVTVADIGIGPDAVAHSGAKLSRNTPALWEGKFLWPQTDGHKYRRGHAVVVSGPAHATGAARLAANAALRAGAGLVTVAASRAAIPVLAASLTAVMVREARGTAGLRRLLADERLNAVLLGPGQGVSTATQKAVVLAANAKRALVLDADAISSFTGESGKLAKLLKMNRISVVLTPHNGEFARLFQDKPKVLKLESKIEKARAAAAALSGVVLLKGADTVVASPDGRASVADNAPPWLATAGSGDVLAGIVLGLIAQGMPVFEAASAAVWLHGEAGREAGIGLISEDLPGALRPVLGRLYERTGAAAT